MDVREDRLLEAINLLWGWMGAAETVAIRTECPWLYDLCQQVHEHVDHGGPRPNVQGEPFS